MFNAGTGNIGVNQDFTKSALLSQHKGHNGSILAITVPRVDYGMRNNWYTLELPHHVNHNTLSRPLVSKLNDHSTYLALVYGTVKEKPEKEKPEKEKEFGHVDRHTDITDSTLHVYRPPAYITLSEQGTVRMWCLNTPHKLLGAASENARSNANTDPLAAQHFNPNPNPKSGHHEKDEKIEGLGLERKDSVTAQAVPEELTSFGWKYSGPSGSAVHSPNLNSNPNPNLNPNVPHPHTLVAAHHSLAPSRYLRCDV
jgi:hypothetical protein